MEYGFDERSAFRKVMKGKCRLSLTDWWKYIKMSVPLI